MGSTSIQVPSAASVLSTCAEAPTGSEPPAPEAVPNPYELLARAGFNNAMQPQRFAEFMQRSMPAPPAIPTGRVAQPSPAPRTRFSGTVVRHGSRFALREGDGDLYALDSTGLAWPFEGEDVLISGYLNPDSGLLHICAIEEADDLRAEAV